MHGGFWERFRSRIEPYAGWEMLCMRAALAWVVFANLPASLPYASMPHPNGIGRWMDLTFLSHPGVAPALRMAAIPCLAAFASGIGSAPALGFLFAAEVAIGSLLNSHGAIGHYSQLLTLILGALFAGACAGQAEGWRTRRRVTVWDSIATQRRMIHWARVLIAGAYLATGITKLEVSRGRWFWDAPNIAVQIAKTQNTITATTGAPADPFYAEQIPRLIVEHPNLSRIFFSPGLWLELIVFVGLIGRGWSAIVGLAVIVLHEMISRLMGLNFKEHEAAMAILYVNLPYWLVLAAGAAVCVSHKAITRSCPQRAWFFYDADCGICTRSVIWLEQRLREAGADVELIGYQEPGASERFPPIDWTHVTDGVQWLGADGTVRRDARAVAAVLRMLPRWWWLGVLMDLPGVAAISQMEYRLVAANRLRISRLLGLNACAIRRRDETRAPTGVVTSRADASGPAADPTIPGHPQDNA